MPQYGLIRYGLYKYGMYQLATNDALAIGPHIPYRIRLIDKDGNKSEFLQMNSERVDISVSESTPIRMRINDGSWVVTKTEEINEEAYKIRIRSVDSNGSKTQWVETERGNLKEI